MHKQVNATQNSRVFVVADSENAKDQVLQGLRAAKKVTHPRIGTILVQSELSSNWESNTAIREFIEQHGGGAPYYPQGATHYYTNE